MSRLKNGLPHPDSPGEQALYRLHQAGRLPGFEFNIAIKPDIVVDLLHREARIVVEIDSDGWHSTPAQVLDDKRRDRRLALLGFTVLRYAHAEATSDPDRTARQIEVIVESRCPSQPAPSREIVMAELPDFTLEEEDPSKAPPWTRWR